MAIGTVVQGISVAMAEDEVPGHLISSKKKISIFPIKTIKENCIVLNTVQFNITFRIITVQGLLKKKKIASFLVFPKIVPFSVPKTTFYFVLEFNKPIFS